MDQLLTESAWPKIKAIAQSLPAKTNLVVPKSALSSPPPYPRSRLGRPHGAKRQYRCACPRGNLHVKEYADRWVVHVDSYHPGRHTFRHLLVDHGFNRFLQLPEWAKNAGVLAPQPVSCQD